MVVQQIYNAPIAAEAMRGDEAPAGSDIVMSPNPGSCGRYHG
jgi:hypothetical protein